MCGLLEVSKQTCTLQSAKCQLIKTMPAVLFVRILCIMEIPPQQRTLRCHPTSLCINIDGNGTSVVRTHHLSISMYTVHIYIHSG